MDENAGDALVAQPEQEPHDAIDLLSCGQVSHFVVSVWVRVLAPRNAPLETRGAQT